MKYEKHITADGYNIVQVYDNHTRIVPENRPDYAHWLAEGNVAEIIPYTAPALPPLDDYKKIKIEWLKNESSRRVSDFSVIRETGGKPEKLTRDIRDTLHAELTCITNKRSNSLILIADELIRETYLLSVWASVGAVQEIEKTKISAVNIAADHSQVDAITWE